MARMPSCAAGARMFITPASVNIERVGGGQEEDGDEDEARRRAEFGPAHDAGRERIVLQSLVRRAPARSETASCPWPRRLVSAIDRPPRHDAG